MESKPTELYWLLHHRISGVFDRTFGCCFFVSKLNKNVSCRGIAKKVFPDTLTLTCFFEGSIPKRNKLVKVSKYFKNLYLLNQLYTHLSCDPVMVHSGFKYGRG